MISKTGYKSIPEPISYREIFRELKHVFRGRNHGKTLPEKKYIHISSCGRCVGCDDCPEVFSAKTDIASLNLKVYRNRDLLARAEIELAEMNTRIAEEDALTGNPPTENNRW